MIRKTEEPVPAPWITHDPEDYRTVVDVPEAAAAGVRDLVVSYDPETNQIEIRTTHDEPEGAA